MSTKTFRRCVSGALTVLGASLAFGTTVRAASPLKSSADAPAAIAAETSNTLSGNEIPSLDEPVLLAQVYQSGIASWYGPGFAGRLSANGEIFDPNQLTAAHPTLPFNTIVRVTNVYNGRSVVVRINDRGPYIGNRVIDLSAAAADAIGIINSGIGDVDIEILN